MGQKLIPMRGLKFLCFTALLASVSFVRGQINAYQYVVVPKKFQDFESENKYRSSTLVKHLLDEEGFIAYYEGEVPADIADICKGLRIELLDESTALRTRVVLLLKDCHGQDVFRTQQGDSREKDLKEGFDDAIREAFRSISALNYHYEPDAAPVKREIPITMNFDGDVKTVAPDTGEKGRPRSPVGDPVVEQEATPEKQSYRDRSPQPFEGQRPGERTIPAKTAPDIWYAQKLPDGYQLVDRSPKIRMRLFNSSLPDVYLAENDRSHGLVYKRGGRWIYEYYENGERTEKELHIEF